MNIALKAIHDIGCAATWQIYINSEHIDIAIGGMQVLLKYGEPFHTFVKKMPPFDIELCILEAADEYEKSCYPERGVRWLPKVEEPIDPPY